MSCGRDCAVLNFDREEIGVVRSVLITCDAGESMKFLKKLEKRLDDAIAPK